MSRAGTTSQSACGSAATPPDVEHAGCTVKEWRRRGQGQGLELAKRIVRYKRQSYALAIQSDLLTGQGGIGLSSSFVQCLTHLLRQPILNPSHPPDCVPLPLHPTLQLRHCTTCGLWGNIWACLVCAHTGCGRYAMRHAEQHYRETQHSFSLELATGRCFSSRHHFLFLHLVSNCISSYCFHASL